VSEPSAFGQYLRTLRKQKHVSQRDLAAQIGVDFTYLSKIETGTLAPPSEDVIRRIAQVLDTNENELINRAGKVPGDLKATLQDNPLLSKVLRMLSEQRFSDEVYCEIVALLSKEQEE
jgi:transcriptional regulator with XRE-family HTH domain